MWPVRLRTAGLDMHGFEGSVIYVLVCRWLLSNDFGNQPRSMCHTKHDNCENLSI